MGPIFLKNLEIDSKFEFGLQRRTGKNIYLSHGNEMVSSNDRLHHAPKAMLMAHLRELGDIFGQRFKQQNDMGKEEFLYTTMNPCHIIVVVNPPSSRRMDAPNWYPTVKGLIDGMADAGIFSDDSDEVVNSITFIPGKRTRNGKYLLELKIIKGQRPHLFKQMSFDEMLDKIS